VIPNWRMKWFYQSSYSSCWRRAMRGCSREIFDLGSCLLQFAKAGSTAMLPQQEKNKSEDVQRGGFIPRGDVPPASSSRMSIASLRARHHRRMFGP
jgi:hypothetical protein